MKKPRLIIAGGDSWYNKGDNAILTGTIQMLKESIPGVELVIFSDRPDLTKKNFPEHRAVYRRNLREVRRELSRADLFLWGGGQLVQNASSQIFMFAQLFIAAQAFTLKIPAMAFAIGADPLKGRLIRGLTRRVLNQYAVVTVRDERSKTALQEMGITKPVEVVADPALVLRPAGEQPGLQNQPVIVAPRRWFHYQHSLLPVKWQVARRSPGEAQYDRFREALTGFCDWVTLETERDILLVSMYPGSEQGDERVCEQIKQGMARPERATVFPSSCGVPDLLQAFQGASLAVTVRMHASILATCAGIPSMGLYYMNKGISFFENLGLAELAFPIGNVQSQTLIDAAAEVLQNYALYQARVLAARSVLSSKASQAAEIARDLLS